MDSTENNELSDSNDEETPTRYASKKDAIPAARSILGPIQNEASRGEKPTIEEIYQKKTQLEHILLRPDTYIGSIEFTAQEPMWIYNQEEDLIKLSPVSFVPGLYKIFDEILVNAADNKQRDKKMDTICVDIDQKANRISIFNNGKGVPVTLHQTEKVYVPELIFGTLLTSSNYNDEEKKTTGGRNGYGAKLCNVFSTEFILETSSSEFKQSFKQTWVNNMTKESEPIIKKATEPDFTRVTFTPDLKKFRMDHLDDDICGLMARRAYDIAGTTKGVKVYLNGKKLDVSNFKEYVAKYLPDPSANLIYEKVNERWEVALTNSTDGAFQSVSFVNSIATSKGGTHVDYVTDMMSKSLIEAIKKKLGTKNPFNLRAPQVKNQMWVFVNCLIENPTFDSQTKVALTLQAKTFGSVCTLSEHFMKQITRSNIVENVLNWVKYKQNEQADKLCSTKKTSKIKGIPKLEDANEAGGKKSAQCTLILTEGDSAKTLAVSGLGVVGRDFYGVFPLRGKVLNVRDCSHKQIMDNNEITSMLKILGLRYSVTYEDQKDRDTLRYGRIMIMADQDQDGSHIKGLIINFIHCNWPALMKHNFVEEFITPIVKVTKGSEIKSFFSIPEYMGWRKTTENWKSYKIKYYKGLGTSTSKEAKEYFSDMSRHRIPFVHSGPECNIAIEMAFSKKKIEERKEWLTAWMNSKHANADPSGEQGLLYHKDTKSVSFVDFINKELVLFSNMDNERSIPCLIDGFKPGQRKVMFTCLKRADKKEVKVAQLAGAVGEMSAYHHGEASLMATIIGLAQDYVGSNNINLLLPIGQFGTRLQGGKDSASARYIFTQLNPVTKTIFHPDDENVLNFLFEENQRIEPEWYCPIIPMVLVNGSEGIGTGWSTKIPNYNPREIIDNIRALIKGKAMKEMIPWYKHFTGSIDKINSNRYVTSGVVSKLSEDSVEITELPIKVWTQSYKERVMEELSNSSEKTPAKIVDYKEYHTDQTVKFICKLSGDSTNDNMHDTLALQNCITTNNMILFDGNGVLRKFNSAEQIIKEFYDVRVEKYKERKMFLEKMLKAQSDRLTNQARFILEKIKGDIVMENKKKKDIVELLIKKKYDRDPVKLWKDEIKAKAIAKSSEVIMEEEDEDGNEESEDANLRNKLSDYDYLVGMALIKLSTEEKDKLLKESETKLAELKVLEGKSWSDLWEIDLIALEDALEKQEARELADIEGAIKTASSKLSKANGTTGRGKKKVNTMVSSFKPDPNGEKVERNLDKMIKSFKKDVDEDGNPVPKAIRKPAVPKVDEDGNPVPKATRKPAPLKVDEDGNPIPKATRKPAAPKVDEDGNPIPPKRKPAAPKVDKDGKSAVSKNKPVASKKPKAEPKSRVQLEFDSDGESEEEVAVAKKPAPKKRAATTIKAEPAKKRKLAFSSGDEDESMDVDSSFEST
uniref:DNA topoisomerase 2 n=1 Tax=Rhabditophanes sp. KR3021 TaxID=114890 RepID=A0AC35UG86_9BILA